MKRGVECQHPIVTRRSQLGSSELDYPKGDPRNPLSDAEVEEKFDALAEPVLSAAGRRAVKETVWRLEELSAVSELMELLAEGR